MNTLSYLSLCSLSGVLVVKVVRDIPIGGLKLFKIDDIICEQSLIGKKMRWDTKWSSACLSPPPAASFLKFTASEIKALRTLSLPQSQGRQNVPVILQNNSPFKIYVEMQYIFLVFCFSVIILMFSLWCFVVYPGIIGQAVCTFHRESPLWPKTFSFTDILLTDLPPILLLSLFLWFRV